MYCPASRVSAETGGRCTSDGLGFWQALIPYATDAIGGIFSGDDARMSVDEYYPAVKAGRLVRQGPYSIANVSGALDRNPSFVAEFDRAIASDGAWKASSYGPITTNAQRASAIVNWAHGGRDDVVQANEADLSSLLDRLLREDQRAAAEALAQQAQGPTIGGVTLPALSIPTPATAEGLAVWGGLTAAAIIAGVVLFGPDRRMRL